MGRAEKAQQGGRSVKNIPCAIKKLGVILQKTQSLQSGVTVRVPFLLYSMHRGDKVKKSVLGGIMINPY